MKSFDDFRIESKRKPKTVQTWIKNGLVNGAVYVDGSYIISDLAWPPYMRASSKNAGTIRKGIVVGCKKRLSVNARVFKISEDEFEVYLNQVINEGLVEKREFDGVSYYFSTPKANDLTESQIYRLVKDISMGVTEAGAKAVAEAAMDRVLGNMK